MPFINSRLILFGCISFFCIARCILLVHDKWLNKVVSSLLYIYRNLWLPWLLLQVELLVGTDDYNDMKPHKRIAASRVVLFGETFCHNVTSYCAPFNGKYEHVSCVVLRTRAVVSFALVLLGQSTTCTYDGINKTFIRSKNYLHHHI